MTTRREVFPMLAGAAGISAAADTHAAVAVLSEPELKRVSYRSARTGKDRDYFVYLPRGFAQQNQWPVLLFLHGDGERGDAKGELDFLLIHGPLFEAWCQRRDLPFVIISPQLDKFSQRLACRCYLAPLTREETFQYVRSQVSAVGVKPDIVDDCEQLDVFPLQHIGRNVER